MYCRWTLGFYWDSKWFPLSTGTGGSSVPTFQHLPIKRQKLPSRKVVCVFYCFEDGMFCQPERSNWKYLKSKDTQRFGVSQAFGGLKSDTPENKHSIFVELSVREELDVSFLRVQQAQPKTSSRGSGGVLIRMEDRRADRPIGARDRYV